MRVVGLGLALAALVLAGCTSASSESASLPPQAVQAEPQAPEVAVTDEKPPSAGPGAGPSAGPGAGPGAVAPAAVTVGERSLVPRQGIHGVALWQPAALEELATVGLPSEGAIPALMVLATEHPSVTPPSLTVQDRGGEAVLVLTWLDFDPLIMGPLPEVADVTYAWRVDGARPRWVGLRKAADAADMGAPLASEQGAATPATALGLASATGPGVALEPGWLQRGADGFFALYGQPRPPGVPDPAVLAAVRATASGRTATAMDAQPLAGGGTRWRLTVPLDPGLPFWGPRAGDAVAAFSSPVPPGAHEWLLELQ